MEVKNKGTKRQQCELFFFLTKSGNWDSQTKQKLFAIRAWVKEWHLVPGFSKSPKFGTNLLNTQFRNQTWGKKKSNIDKYLTETLIENIHKKITSSEWRVQETDLWKTVMSLCVLRLILRYFTAAQRSLKLSMRFPCMMVCVCTVHNKLSHILPHRL